MKRTVLILLVQVLMFPRLLLALSRFYVLSMVVGRDNGLLDISDVMRGWRGLPGIVARRSILRIILGRGRISSSATINSCLMAKADTYIEENVYIGCDCSLGRVTIQQGALLSDQVIVMSGSRQHAKLENAWIDGESVRVTIGSHAWIGAGAIVMANVGAHAVVGAGAVVTRSVPDHATVAGIPAKSTSR